MFVQTLKDIVPSSLDDDTNEYNITDHLPYPTFPYVEKETGIDMLGGIGEREALPTLRYMTKFTMNTLKSLVYPPSRVMLEFLIAKSAEHRKAFIDTVCVVIATTKGKGLQDFLATGDLTSADLPKMVQASARANGLLTQYYSEILPTEEVRKDY